MLSCSAAPSTAAAAAAALASVAATASVAAEIERSSANSVLARLWNVSGVPACGVCADCGGVEVLEGEGGVGWY